MILMTRFEKPGRALHHMANRNAALQGLSPGMPT
jgi:hypothetical protein